jgi:TonB family protein
VKTGGFGESNGTPGGSGHNTGGAVQPTGFGDSTQAAAPVQHHELQAAPSTTPVEILFKPRPSYTAEAKNLHLEGQVSIEVVFTSSGSVRVVRVVRGLGHGLDEAAEQAALKVRFKPATRGGVPVDTNATINITFELT